MAQSERNESKYLRKRNINEEILLEKSIHLIFFHYIMELFTKLDVFLYNGSPPNDVSNEAF